MSKLFVRAALIGCAAAGTAVAQTAPLAPTSTTTPTVSITARVTSPSQGKMILKTIDVADLVCPPADSPLAKPGTDPAMTAAAKSFTEVRAEELVKAIRTGTERGWWDEFGGGGKLVVTTDGKTLVVNHTPAVVDKVGACIESMRQLRSACVKVEMVVVKVPSKNEAMAKLLGEKGHAAVSADEFNVMLRELKACGAADVLARPNLVLKNKQTGFCQVGEPMPLNTPSGVIYTQEGMTTRLTPEVSADLKSVALVFEYEDRQAFGGPLPGVNSCEGKANLVLPDGGTVAVRVSTRKEERKTECKAPVVSDIPYLGRLFRNVSSTTEPVDTVAVITTTRVNGHECLAASPMTWSVATPTPPTVAPVPPSAPAVTPAGVTLTPTVVRLAPFAPPVMPAPVALAPTTAPYAAPLPAMPAFRVIGTNGLERIGVDFTTLTTADTLPKAKTGVRVEAQPGTHMYKFATGDVVAVTGGTVAVSGSGCCTPAACDTACPLMTAYKAACAAGNKDEAARLALQLLANDPTCFGKK